LYPSSCRSIGNYNMNFNKKKGATPYELPPIPK
jgi:hypothetical protein